MKLNLFYSIALVASTSISAFAQNTDENGYSTVNLSLKQNYYERAYFNFDNGAIENRRAKTWDIAFYRGKEVGTRLNDMNGMSAYLVSNDISDWDKIGNAEDIVAGKEKEALYNPNETDKVYNGALQQVKWWEEKENTIKGNKIFIIKHNYSQFPEYRKFMIEERSEKGDYLIKYAFWTGAGINEWGATRTFTIPKGEGKALFDYYQFYKHSTRERDLIINNAEPNDTTWDLMFERYHLNDIGLYAVGAVQNLNLRVAKHTDETQATVKFDEPKESEFSDMITTIGHDWKNFDSNSFQFILKDRYVYYVKKGANYYRMYFTRMSGSVTGNLSFKYKNITEELGVQDLNKKADFGIYPNPTVDKKATLLFDVKEKDNNKGTAELYDFSGKKVYETTLSNQTGLYKKEINLQSLSTGTYILKVSYGGASQTRKIIVK